MTFNTRICLILFSFLVGGILHSQVNSLQIDPEKEKMYTPYMYPVLGGPEGVADYKKNHPHDYLKLLWYYSESFYVKRDKYSVGDRMNEAMIAISRYEHFRKEDEEAEVELVGYRDVIVLLPTNKLIYKPSK